MNAQKSIVSILFLSSLFIFLGLNPSINNPQQKPKGPWVVPADKSATANPFAGNVKSTDEGRTVFNSYCYPCHGMTGEGNGPSATQLIPKPANLSSKQVQSQTDGSIFWKISTGRGQMAAWQQIISEKQRWALVNFIRHLGTKK